ncbi:MAG: acetyl-CoA carboxylase biotin carboxylase subunit [Oscillospiraceae bacterium]|nr:acetyl-CoA carboxylase biotin carboxylase subunit [Oscillospiraceae bacterium]
MLKKILIANRGEIAVRIIRACKELGIESVAIYSTAEHDALHVQLADEAICVGEPRAVDSYLNMQNILSAACNTGCDAVHPGYGFLSENSKFARLVNQCRLTFIGPDPEIIDLMGNKASARATMIKHNVPVVPGSDSVITSITDGLKWAKEVGYPVLIKASSGGGGKGMRIAYNPKELETAYKLATAEAKANFGDDSVYLEKFIENPKHIEIQVMGDHHQNYVHFYERDCSVQRNYQKVIEEAPCAVLREDVRQNMIDAAINAVAALNYTNAGTIEFILDQDQNYYFIEMNTRIQVEHPISEMITGVDLIKEQIRVASGFPLSVRQEDIHRNGYAMECRINAENAFNGFQPSSGKVETLILPGGFGVRVDTYLYQGANVPPFYDSMVGKLIVHGNNREECIYKMRRALEEFIVEGITTNIDFHYYLLHNSNFVNGEFDVGFIGRVLMELEKYE